MKSKHLQRIKALVVALSLFVVASGALSAASGQKSKASFKRDANALRRAFAEACAGDFEIVKDEFRDRTAKQGGEGFWLVYFMPKHSGEFTIKYRYDYNEPLYTYVEHEINLNVGERGCRRLSNNGTIVSACLGDTIILPVVVNNFKGHTFSLTSREAQKDVSQEIQTAWRESEEKGLSAEPVNNPASEFMKYVGRQVHYMPHRSPGYTLEHTAMFEAVKPGKFNIALAPRMHGDTQTSLSASGSVPVVIVEKNAPVTLLLSRESVVGRDEKHGFESYSGNEYLTSVKILQVGDRLTLTYSGRNSRGEAVRDADDMQAQWLKEVVPVIGLLPFSVDTEYNYDSWIVDYLNAPTQRQ
jgi:hypothetical protein